jgi:hypothetical protein
MSPFRPPVSASKISVPDSNVRDRFDDWVGSWQFGPYQLHHPVCRYRTLLGICIFVPRDAGFSVVHLVSGWSLRVEMPAFTRLSLHQKIPFLAPLSETGSMTAWGVGSSVHTSPTTQSIGIELRRISEHLSRGPRAFRVYPSLRIGLHAKKRRFLPVRLCIKKFSSWPRCWSSLTLVLFGLLSSRSDGPT